MKILLPVKKYFLNYFFFVPKRTQLIGIKYTVSLNNKDPLLYRICDPTKHYFEPYFAPLNLASSPGLLARRFYVYSSLVRNENFLRNEELMKSKITDIWLKKNREHDLENQRRNFSSALNF